MKTRTFGRRVQFDERSRAFPIRALIQQDKPRSYTWRCDICLDQGSTPACTGYAMAHELAARPCVVPNVSGALASRLYKRAQQLDEWEGEDYAGSSVLAAVKAAKEMGYINEYRWAFGVDDLALAVSRHGPAILGINWYSEMDRTDEKGILFVSGELLGGHAILCNGYNTKTRFFRLHNSWGESWGIKGECFMSYSAMDRLLNQQGEACIPVVRGKGS